MKLLTILLSLTALAISASHMARGEQVNITHSGVPALGLGASPTIDSQSMGSLTSGRAVVVIEGGGAPHPFTTPFAACKEGRDTYIQRMIDAGLPVFTAPGFTNLNKSTTGKTGCPPQPPIEVQWNTSAYPTQAGQSVLGFLGYLHETYGYRTFDLVGWSFGGVVARATVAALKKPFPLEIMAPGFSYAQIAVNSAVSIPSIITMNSPHLGSPAYDIASDPTKYLFPVTRDWGRKFANNSKALIPFVQDANAGAIQVLKTSSHAEASAESWDAQQVGVLEGVSLTLIAGDYCGRRCPFSVRDKTDYLRTDGTVPVYSQLVLPCPTPCRTPPGSVYIPDGLIPAANVVRKTFGSVHSDFDARRLHVPLDLSVTRNTETIDYILNDLLTKWQSAGAPLLRR